MNTQTEFALGEVDTDDMLAHLDELELPSHKWAGVLAQMIDILNSHFQRHGRNADAAIIESQQIVLEIAQYLGGRPLYLPRGDRLRAALVARQIYLQHDGRNVELLAERTGYSVRHIQRIIAEQHQLHIRKHQGRLFAD